MNAADSTFVTEYLCQPRETEAEHRLRRLAEEYHERTERYDRCICTGPIRDGSIMPANGHEMGMINVHAKAVMEELGEEVRCLGFTTKQWMSAIQASVKVGQSSSRT